MQEKQNRNIWGEFLIPCIAIGYAIYYYITAKELVWTARIYSLCMSWGILFLGLIIILQNVVINRKCKAAEASEIKKQSDRKYYILTFSLIILSFIYVFLMTKCGFLITTSLYVFLSIYLQNYIKRNEIKIKFNEIGFSIIYAVAAYLIFIYIFRIDLPQELMQRLFS